METKVLLDNEIARVVYERENELAFVDWKKRPNFEQYKEVPLTIIEHAKNNPLKHYMADNSKQGVVSQEMKNWWMEEAIPKAAARGITKAAIIIDDNPFRIFYMNIMVKYAKQLNLGFKVFSSQDQARKWLISKN